MHVIDADHFRGLTIISEAAKQRMYLSPRRGFASLGLRWLIRLVGAAEQ